MDLTYLSVELQLMKRLLPIETTFGENMDEKGQASPS